MRILLLTQLFEPEPNYLKGLAFARFLRDNGFDVEVLTGFPNYPGGKIYCGYRQRLWQREEIDGIRILRVPLYPYHGASGVGRMSCYLSMAASMSLLGPLLSRRCDLIHVYQGPATLCIPARILSMLWRTPVVLDTQDLWPESVTASGMLRPKMLEGLLEWYCRWTLRFPRRFVVLSRGYRDRLVQRGVDEKRTVVVYNWAPQLLEDQTEADLTIAADGTFDILYAGNIGPVQALGVVLDAARILAQSHPRVCFKIIGDGAEKGRLETRARGMGLENVVFRGRIPLEDLRREYRRSAALLVHLKAHPLSEVGIPSKTQASLAAGRPVLMGVAGEATELVDRSGGGIAFEPGNAESLAKAVERLGSMQPRERMEIGRSGRRFYDKFLSSRVGMEAMRQVFHDVLEEEG